MDIQEYIKKYQNGDSITSLARQHNITPYKAKKILVDNNVQIRTRAQQNVISNQKRAKSVNHEYFSNVITLNQAWLLGFLMADGYVSANDNSIGLELSAIDKEILKKIKKEIQSERDIKIYTTNKGFEIAKMYWSSGKQKKDLEKYGIVNKKTYKENHLPLFNNDNLTNAFILGFFDGDGYLHINKNQATMNICAHRKELLQDIANYIQNKYGGSYSLTKDNRELWNYNLSTTILIKYFDDAYSKAILFLNRKKEKYEKWKINRI